MVKSKSRAAQALIVLVAALNITIVGATGMSDKKSNTKQEQIKPYIIYLITNSVNGKVYVGQTRNGLIGRWSDHVYSAGHGSKHRIHQAIRKYGTKCFEMTELTRVMTQSEANAEETRFIALYSACGYSHGYNMAPIAFGVSDEARKKLSAKFSGSGNPMYGKPGTRLGTKNSPETLAKRAATFAVLKAEGVRIGGPDWTPERKEYMRALFTGIGSPSYGKQCSEETRAKMSAAKKGVPLKLSIKEREARSERAAGANNPMFGRKLSKSTISKKKKRWAEFRAAGRKMNLTEEQRELRRQQAANARAKLAILIAVNGEKA